jgi:cytochrome c oxidase subunit 2
MRKVGAPIRLAAVVAGSMSAPFLLAACSALSPSTLNAQGPGAHTIAGLWWFMFAVSAAVIAFVGLLLLVGIRPRRAPSREDDTTTPPWVRTLIVGGGVVFPVIILSVLWVLTLKDMAALSDPTARLQYTVDVIGHQWWWEVRYPDQGIVTANDIHIPTDTTVHVVLTTDDVLHSFWVPQLTAKTDLIAGRVNRMTLEASKPGVYRGQCAEFCGLQHANMAFYVIAEPLTAFSQWVAHEQAPLSTPADPTLALGQQVFVNAPCAACHAIRGVSMPIPPGSTLTGHGPSVPITAVQGPDLSDFGGRITIGAGTLPNNVGNLGGWMANSQAIKPGNYMPPMPLSPLDLQALIAYLESLK